MRNVPFFLSMTTAFCSEGVLELDLSESAACDRESWGCGGCLVAAGWVCLAAVPAAAAAAAAAAADDDADADDIAGMSLMSLASMPISCICLARFSAWLINCMGADRASTRSDRRTINNDQKITTTIVIIFAASAARLLACFTLYVLVQ